MRAVKMSVWELPRTWFVNPSCAAPPGLEPSQSLISSTLEIG